jgi:cytochrome P450
VPLAAAGTSFPPGPRAPAVVQALRYSRDPIGFFVRLRRRYGDVFSVSFPGFGRIVYLANPGLVKEVFTGDPARFHAGEANATVLEPALGKNSVLTLDGDEHLRQRKLLLPPFHGDRVRRYGEVMRAITERDMESWPVGEPFALRPHTEAITLEVILRAVFGVHEPERIASARKVIGEFARRSSVLIEFPFLRRSFGRFSPWARFVRARAALDAFIYEQIAARRADPSGDERDDVLSLLLQAKHDDGSPMSDEELRDELATVIGAGHETTATALAWALERLLRTPTALARLRESLQSGRDEYLEATIKETLRARPVVVDVARKLSAPTEIAGYRLAGGTFVLPAIAALHYRDDLFPDPGEFRPERFLDGEAERYSWIPFGGGVRRCVGAAFAQFEMRVMLRAILERAQLRAPDPRPERLAIRNITLAPGRGTWVVLEQPLRTPAQDHLAAGRAVASLS